MYILVNGGVVHCSLLIWLCWGLHRYFLQDNSSICGELRPQISPLRLNVSKSDYTLLGSMWKSGTAKEVWLVANKENGSAKKISSSNDGVLNRFLRIAKTCLLHPSVFVERKVFPSGQLYNATLRWRRLKRGRCVKWRWIQFFLIKGTEKNEFLKRLTLTYLSWFLLSALPELRNPVPNLWWAAVQQGAVVNDRSIGSVFITVCIFEMDARAAGPLWYGNILW